MKKFLLRLCLCSSFGLSAATLAWADTCADLRTIDQQAASHFDGWKKDPNEGGYGASFMLDGAAACNIGGNSNSYSCLWRFASAADLGRAYARLVEQVKACAPLVSLAPGIINDQPDAREQNGVRQELDITGFDYADAGVTVLVGQMRATGRAGLSRNELKFTYVKSAAAPTAAPAK